MEAKRELTSVDIAAVATELRGFTDAFVDKAYLYGEDLVRLKLRHPERGRAELLLEVGEIKRAHLADPDHVPDAPERPPDFARKLRNRIGGASLAGVEQYEFDRILRLEFDRPDESTTLVAELFGDGNVAVLDPTGDVTACLETVRLKSRTVVPGAQYEYPSSRLNPLRLNYEGFAARMDESDSDLVRTLATLLNFGGLYGEELCARAGVEMTRSIEEATDEDYQALFDEVQDLKETLASGRFDPRVYREDDRPIDVTPFPLVEREGLDVEAYDSFNDALDAYFWTLERETDRTPNRPDFEDAIAKRERIIDQQERAIERFEAEAAAEREKAELLYAHYDLVDEILTTVRTAREEHDWDEIEERFAAGREQGIEAAEAVTGIDPQHGTVTVELEDYRIELDPRDGVEKNADRLYTEGKRIEEKRAGALDAIEDTREELADLERRRDEWAAEPETAQADSEPVDWLARPSIPVRKADPWFDRFRWFHTTDGFLVIGGRNADQNEELVKKYLEPGDRFFHTQAHGAPATILKATDPSESSREVDFPETTLEQAAQFAVTYSSIWKDGHYSGDAYMVSPDQVTKTPEPGEYVEKGSFVIRGDRTYFEDTPVGCAVGIRCEPSTGVIGGPPTAIREQAVTTIEVEPGEYAQADVAKRIYRTFRDRFADTSFVRKVASPDEIGRFLPPGQSRIVD